MATITQSAMSNLQRPVTTRKGLLTGICIAVPFFSFSALGEVDLRAGVGADAIQQNIEAPNRDDRSLTTFTVEPTVTALYRSPTLSGAVNGNVVYIDRDRNDASREDTYAEYNYNGQWTPFDRLLTLSASGATTYRNANAGNFLVSDFLTNSQSLTKVRSQRYAATVQLDQGNYVRTYGTLAYSTVSADGSPVGNNNRLDNDTYVADGNLRNGENATRLFWTLTGSYQKTDGDNIRAARGDFISRRGSANIDMMVIGDWGLRATGTHEQNQISDRNDTGSRTREFNSYGAGIIYRQSEARYIAVTANRSESDLAQDDNETFVGADLRWAFSSRTDIAASYGRRFYGDSASAAINYNTKNLRTSFNYDENVTNTSRLVSDPLNLGLFVCPAGSGTFADCFQPDSLDYQPGPDEQAIELILPNVEFADNIIVRKNASGQLGYTFSRISVGLSLRFSEDDFLNQERLRETNAIAVNMTYRVGSFTRVNARIQYAEVEQTATDLESGSSQNLNSSIGLSRQLGRNLKAEVKFAYIEKDGNLTAGSVFGPEFTDRRVSIGISYQYN